MSMRSTIFAPAVLATSVVLAGAAPAHAQANPQARYLAGNCANCHGTDGRSAGGGGMPGLAGLSQTYFMEQMKAFRDGTRKATIMNQIVKGYSDDQLAALAEFFSQQRKAGQ